MYYILKDDSVLSLDGTYAVFSFKNGDTGIFYSEDDEREDETADDLIASKSEKLKQEHRQLAVKILVYRDKRYSDDEWTALQNDPRFYCAESRKCFK